MTLSRSCFVPLAIAGSLATTSLWASDDPFADSVVSYEPGADADPAYGDPGNTLGRERFTGEGIFPAVVSPFNPPWGTDEILSIGKGGWIVLQFDTPVTNDPGNPWGIDLLVFGNSGYIDSDWPSGVVGGLFGDDGGQIEVSEDGSFWVLVEFVSPDGPFPTLGYLDRGPYDTEPGGVEANFTRPVDPALMLDDLLGLPYEDLLLHYSGAGGGVGVDLESVGLDAISYVRISNPVDAADAIEIDALSDVSAVVIGDVTGDGAVDVFDLLAVLANWGDCPSPPDPCPADLDGNGSVDVLDLLSVLANWTG